MPDFDIVIAGGTVISPTTVTRADVAVLGSRIAAVGQDLSGQTLIDATGCYVIPGAIDPHVHLQMPLGSTGLVSSDNFRSGTIAAALGGTTTIIDFVEPRSGQGMLSAMDDRRALADPTVAIDYGLHMTIRPWIEEGSTNGQVEHAIHEIPIAMKAGITSFKLYMAYSGLRLDDDQLRIVFRDLAESPGALPIIHAEDGPLCDTLREEALGRGQTAVHFHALTRPPHQEAEATARALRLADEAGAPLYIVHISCSDALNALRSARLSGNAAFGETCPHYLTLTQDAYRRADGYRFVGSPPLRTTRDQDNLWAAFASALVSTLATDHCPFTDIEKAQASSFAGIPGGLPGIQARLSLAYSFGVGCGKISLDTWVKACSTNAAELFGLTSKGRIAPAYDADIVVFDPQHELVLDAATLCEDVDWTPYAGMKLQGWPRTVLSRGEVIVNDGVFVGVAGRGLFVERDSSGGLSDIHS